MTCSAELRRFFEDPAHAAKDEVVALLSMAITERRVLGAEERDGMLRQDVAQVTVGFSEHRLVALGPTPQSFRAEVGARCGYHDAAYFCRAFRRMCGVSPGEFRSSGMF